MRKCYQFNLKFLSITLLGLLGVRLFNVAIDPYGILKSEKINGLSQMKPKKFSNVSLFKASDVARIQPKTIFLGSSRTDQGLDPDHPALSDIQPVYNLALLGPNMYEIKRYFEHALANQPDSKRVVVGIDFLSFNEYFGNKIGFDESRLGKRHLPRHYLTQTILSLDSLGASLETINSNIHSDAFYLYKENGRRYVYEGYLDRLSMQATFQSSISEAAGGTYRRIVSLKNIYLIYSTSFKPAVKRTLS